MTLRGPRPVKREAFLAGIAEIAAAFKARIEAEVDGFPADPAAAKARRTRAEKDFAFFCRAYFPHHVRGNPSVFHTWLFDTLPGIVAEPEGVRLVIAAPRGNAKTTYVSQLFVLWCVLTGRKRYPFLLSDSTDQACGVLEGVKAELEVNRRLAQDWPDATGQGPTWQVGVIVTRGGAKIEAGGSGRRLRGRRHGAHRPDLVICDDLENDENVRTPEQRDKLEAWVDKAVEPLGPPDGSMDLIYVGTILHYDAVLSRKLKNPLWRHKVFRAIIRPSAHPDLWEAWEAELRNNGEAAADAFYAQAKADMDEGAEVLWPAVQPLVRLMKIKIRIGQAAFDSEYLNDPVNQADALFGTVLFWAEPKRTWIHFGAVDPSLGKENKGRDPSAILVGALDRETGVLDVVEASIRRRVPDRIIEDVIAAQAEYRCLRWGIETVQFQAFLMSEVIKRSAARGIPVPAVGITHLYPKELRIESLQPHVVNGLIRFRADQTELLAQLRHYPHADHDDGPDALEMLWRTALGGAGDGKILSGGRRTMSGGRGGMLGSYVGGGFG